MSEFDKEAEREKLRKKFEQEESRRETTQQMSELLLQGATMLNLHCAECASPIFRHEGKEFCPTCKRTADEIETTGPGAMTGMDTPTPEATSAPEDATDDEPEPPVEPTTSPQETEADTASETTTIDAEAESIPVDRAAESLTRAITRLSDRAATAEDPRQSKELLDAAHQAAETLQVLRR